MDKDYINQEYRLAYLDYKIATCDDNRNAALKNMSRLELLASQMFGFEYCDSLRKENNIENTSNIE